MATGDAVTSASTICDQSASGSVANDQFASVTSTSKMVHITVILRVGAEHFSGICMHSNISWRTPTPVGTSTFRWRFPHMD